MWKLNERRAIVATTDFFMPIVDDPYDFGAIAATNAISDIYAMGGTPLFALALVGMPIDKLPVETIRRILEGGEAICAKAGIPVAGGHTIDSAEPIYGLVAIGVVDPANVKRNAGAQPGDALVLGKPLGIGVYSAALKKDHLTAPHYAAMIASATQLNTPGIVLGTMESVHALTDVTGFGLAGHLLEICRASSVGACVEFARVALLPGVLELAREGFVTGASARNWSGYGSDVTLLGVTRRARARDRPADLGRPACRVRAGGRRRRTRVVPGRGLPASRRDRRDHRRRAAHRAPLTAAMTEIRAGRSLGLYPAADFRVKTGAAAGVGTLRQALWYFRDETIAVPIAGKPIASFTPGVRVDDDLRGWLAARHDDPQGDYPPLVWIASPDAVVGAQLADNGAELATPSGNLAFRVTPRIALNRSYYDTSSARYFSTRTAKVRGTIANGAIVARTLWPEEFRLALLPPLRPLSAAAPRRLHCASGCAPIPRRRARSPFAVESLWRRAGTSDDLRGRAVIGIMVNGAQGDDDEAHAGISRSSPAACRRTARSATGSSTISTRSMPRAKKAFSRRPFRSTTTLPISMPDKDGTGRRACSSRSFPATGRPRCCSRRSGASTTSFGGIRSSITTR